jgi:hypothetical protein
MPSKLKAGQNCWAVICPEPDAPGVWGTWAKEHCVAIGWPPSRHHFYGKTKHKNWGRTRKQIQRVQPGDIIVPFLKHFTFGTPGIVKRVAARDDEWNPTVPKSGYSRNPSEPELGRRIKVEWLTKDVPPLNKVAFMPERIRTTYGQVRNPIERVHPERYARFMKIITDRNNWIEYQNENSPTQVRAATGDRTDTTAGAASFLAEEKLYLERARKAFPILARLAQARQKIFYSDLADELEMRNPRNLNDVLGAVGKAIQELSTKWKKEIPPLQCLVVNKKTGLPGEGVAWFVTNLKDFSERTPEEKKQILGVELVKVFNYSSWEKVLDELRLVPLSTDPVITALKAKACRMGGIGEQEDHRNLKHYIANNPHILGISVFAKGDTEYCFPSADRMDVVFHDDNNSHWVGVEVKGPSSGDADILRGLFQCVKYSALREAELKSDSKKGSTRVVLVLSGKLPLHLKQTKNLLGVEVVEGVIVPDNVAPV